MAENIVEITEPVEFAIVGDRLQFTLTSGRKKRTYAISFHKARNANHSVRRLLDDRERGATVWPFPRKDVAPPAHG